MDHTQETMELCSDDEVEFVKETQLPPKESQNKDNPLNRSKVNGISREERYITTKDKNITERCESLADNKTKNLSKNSSNSVDPKPGCSKEIFDNNDKRSGEHQKNRSTESNEMDSSDAIMDLEEYLEKINEDVMEVIDETPNTNAENPQIGMMPERLKTEEEERREEEVSIFMEVSEFSQMNEGNCPNTIFENMVEETTLAAMAALYVNQEKWRKLVAEAIAELEVAEGRETPTHVNDEDMNTDVGETDNLPSDDEENEANSSEDTLQQDLVESTNNLINGNDVVLEEEGGSVSSEESGNDIASKEAENRIALEEVENDVPSEEVENGVPSEEVENDVPSQEVENDVSSEVKENVSSERQVNSSAEEAAASDTVQEEQVEESEEGANKNIQNPIEIIDLTEPLATVEISVIKLEMDSDVENEMAGIEDNRKEPRRLIRILEEIIDLTNVCELENNSKTVVTENNSISIEITDDTEMIQEQETEEVSDEDTQEFDTMLQEAAIEEIQNFTEDSQDCIDPCTSQNIIVTKKEMIDNNVKNKEPIAGVKRTNKEERKWPMLVPEVIIDLTEDTPVIITESKEVDTKSYISANNTETGIKEHTEVIHKQAKNEVSDTYIKKLEIHLEENEIKKKQNLIEDTTSNISGNNTDLNRIVEDTEMIQEQAVEEVGDRYIKKIKTLLQETESKKKRDIIEDSQNRVDLYIKQDITVTKEETLSTDVKKNESIAGVKKADQLTEQNILIPRETIDLTDTAANFTVKNETVKNLEVAQKIQDNAVVREQTTQEINHTPELDRRLEENAHTEKHNNCIPLNITIIKNKIGAKTSDKEECKRPRLIPAEIVDITKQDTPLNFTLKDDNVKDLVVVQEQKVQKVSDTNTQELERQLQDNPNTESQRYCIPLNTITTTAVLIDPDIEQRVGDKELNNEERKYKLVPEEIMDLTESLSRNISENKELEEMQQKVIQNRRTDPESQGIKDMVQDTQDEEDFEELQASVVIAEVQNLIDQSQINESDSSTVNVIVENIMVKKVPQDIGDKEELQAPETNEYQNLADQIHCNESNNFVVTDVIVEDMEQEVTEDDIGDAEELRSPEIANEDQNFILKDKTVKNTEVEEQQLRADGVVTEQRILEVNDANTQELETPLEENNMEENQNRFIQLNINAAEEEFVNPDIEQTEGDKIIENGERKWPTLIPEEVINVTESLSTNIIENTEIEDMQLEVIQNMETDLESQGLEDIVQDVQDNEDIEEYQVSETAESHNITDQGQIIESDGSTENVIVKYIMGQKNTHNGGVTEELRAPETNEDPNLSHQSHNNKSNISVVTNDIEDIIIHEVTQDIGDTKEFQASETNEDQNLTDQSHNNELNSSAIVMKDFNGDIGQENNDPITDSQPIQIESNFIQNDPNDNENSDTEITPKENQNEEDITQYSEIKNLQEFKDYNAHVTKEKFEHETGIVVVTPSAAEKSIYDARINQIKEVLENDEIEICDVLLLNPQVMLQESQNDEQEYVVALVSKESIDKNVGRLLEYLSETSDEVQAHTTLSELESNTEMISNIDLPSTSKQTENQELDIGMLSDDLDPILDEQFLTDTTDANTLMELEISKDELDFETEEERERIRDQMDLDDIIHEDLEDDETAEREVKALIEEHILDCLVGDYLREEELKQSNENIHTGDMVVLKLNDSSEVSNETNTVESPNITERLVKSNEAENKEQASENTEDILKEGLSYLIEEQLQKFENEAEINSSEDEFGVKTVSEKPNSEIELKAPQNQPSQAQRPETGPDALNILRDQNIEGNTNQLLTNIKSELKINMESYEPSNNNKSHRKHRESKHSKDRSKSKHHHHKERRKSTSNQQSETQKQLESESDSNHRKAHSKESEFKSTHEHRDKSHEHKSKHSKEKSKHHEKRRHESTSKSESKIHRDLKSNNSVQNKEIESNKSEFKQSYITDSSELDKIIVDGNKGKIEKCSTDKIQENNSIIPTKHFDENHNKYTDSQGSHDTNYKCTDKFKYENKSKQRDTTKKETIKVNDSQLQFQDRINKRDTTEADLSNSQSKEANLSSKSKRCSVSKHSTKPRYKEKCRSPSPRKTRKRKILSDSEDECNTEMETKPKCKSVDKRASSPKKRKLASEFENSNHTRKIEKNKRLDAYERIKRTCAELESESEPETDINTKNDKNKKPSDPHGSTKNGKDHSGDKHRRSGNSISRSKSSHKSENDEKSKLVCKIRSNSTHEHRKSSSKTKSRSGSKVDEKPKTVEDKTKELCNLKQKRRKTGSDVKSKSFESDSDTKLICKDKRKERPNSTHEGTGNTGSNHTSNIVSDSKKIPICKKENKKKSDSTQKQNDKSNSKDKSNSEENVHGKSPKEEAKPRSKECSNSEQSYTKLKQIKTESKDDKKSSSKRKRSDDKNSKSKKHCDKKEKDENDSKKSQSLQIQPQIMEAKIQTQIADIQSENEGEGKCDSVTKSQTAPVKTFNKEDKTLEETSTNESGRKRKDTCDSEESQESPSKTNTYPKSSKEETLNAANKSEPEAIQAEFRPNKRQKTASESEIPTPIIKPQPIARRRLTLIPSHIDIFSGERPIKTYIPVDNPMKKENLIKCQTCFKNLSPGELGNHKCFTNDFVYCNTCKRNLRTDIDLRKHQTVEHTQKKQENTEISLPTRKKITNDSTKFVCQHCTKPFSWEITMKTHVRQHLTSKEMYPFGCRVCGISYVDRNPYIAHKCFQQDEKKNTSDGPVQKPLQILPL